MIGSHYARLDVAMNVNPSAKRVLVFGDSNTWGRVPGIFERYDPSIRWTCLVQSMLGDGFEIIEEGLRGRTLQATNPMFRDRDGSTQYGPVLASHFPLDLVVIFLGNNDAATREPEQIAQSISRYVAITERRCEELQADLPRLALVASPIIDDSALDSNDQFKGATERTEKLAEFFAIQAKAHGMAFFDASRQAVMSRVDGIHLDATEHLRLAHFLAPLIHIEATK